MGVLLIRRAFHLQLVWVIKRQEAMNVLVFERRLLYP